MPRPALSQALCVCINLCTDMRQQGGTSYAFRRGKLFLYFTVSLRVCGVLCVCERVFTWDYLFSGIDACLQSQG